MKKFSDKKFRQWIVYLSNTGVIHKHFDFYVFFPSFSTSFFSPQILQRFIQYTELPQCIQWCHFLFSTPVVSLYCIRAVPHDALTSVSHTSCEPPPIFKSALLDSPVKTAVIRAACVPFPSFSPPAMLWHLNNAQCFVLRLGSKVGHKNSLHPCHHHEQQPQPLIPTRAADSLLKCVSYFATHYSGPPYKCCGRNHGLSGQF